MNTSWLILRGMGDQPMGANFGEVPSPDLDEDFEECMEDCDTCIWRSAEPESDGIYRCNDIYGEGYKEKKITWDKHNTPAVDDEGISDPVTIFTDNGMVLTGWWNANTGYWNCIESNGRDFDTETFGNVVGWLNIDFPKGWHYDKELYR